MSRATASQIVKIVCCCHLEIDVQIDSKEGRFVYSVLRLARNKVTDLVGSHGCVRLAEMDAKVLFEWAPMGTMVRIQ